MQESLKGLQEYSDQFIKMMIEYAPSLLLAILTLIIGLWIIKLVVKGVNKASEKSKVDASLSKFLSSLGIVRN